MRFVLALKLHLVPFILASFIVHVMRSMQYATRCRRHRCDLNLIGSEWNLMCTIFVLEKGKYKFVIEEWIEELARFSSYI